MQPPRFASYLWHLVRGNKVPDEVSFNDVPGQAPPKIHNFYGWRAEKNIEQRGICSGALYRTAGYMSLAPSARCGDKGQFRTVHIEHSVPIAVLVASLKFYASRFDTPGELHNFLIKHSVTAAFSEKEEKRMQRIVKASSNSAFKKTGERAGNFPFARYKPLQQGKEEFRLFNVVMGTEIDLETFTFEDHLFTLNAASQLCGICSGFDLGVYDGNVFNPNDWFFRG